MSLDFMKRIRAYYNYLQFLQANQSSDQEKIGKLEKMLRKCERDYLIGFEESKIKCERTLKNKSEDCRKAIRDVERSKITELDWCIKVLNKIEKIDQIHDNNKFEKAFWEKISSEFLSQIIEEQNEEENVDYDEEHEPKIIVEYTLFGRKVRDFVDLKNVLTNISSTYNNLTLQRSLLFNYVTIFNNVDKKMIDTVSKCHLKYNLCKSHVKDVPKKIRTNENANKTPEELKQEQMRQQQEIEKALNGLRSSKRCDLCKFDDEISNYAKFLFPNAEDLIKFTRSSKKDEEEEDGFENYQARTGRNDIEKFFKCLSSFCKKSDSFSDYQAHCETYLDMYSKLKDEFKLISDYWVFATNEISAHDELDMSKVTLRLLGPNESNPLSLDYLIENQKVNTHLQNLTNEVANFRTFLNKRLGQLLFLKNTYKVSENMYRIYLIKRNLRHFLRQIILIVLNLHEF